MTAEPETPANDLDATHVFESVVVADFGRGTSRAYLLEQIAGAFRFVARAEGPSTIGPPFNDLTIGWTQLLRQLEWDAGRTLVDRSELIMPQSERGDGVDSLLVCATLGEPVRVAVIESGQSSAVASLLSATRRAYTRLLHIAPPTGGKKDAGWLAGQSEALRTFQADYVIVILTADHGGSTSRSLQLLKTSGAATSIRRGIIVADASQSEAATTLFSPAADIRTTSTSADDVLTIVGVIEQELNDLYAKRLSSEDFDAIRRDSANPVVARAPAVDLVNRFVARAFKRQVITIGIDDGSHAHWADSESGVSATVPQIDLGPSLSGLTAREVADAARWLPFAPAEDELLLWVLNRSIRPWGYPESERDVLIEQAFARQIARRVLGEIVRMQPLALTGADLVIGGQAFGRWHQPGAAALALLDSLDVIPDHGVLDLAIDPDGLMTVAGVIGAIVPGLASDVFEYDGLAHLGSAVVIGGQVKDGNLACRGEIHYDSGTTNSFQVNAGSVELLPLNPGQTATLVLRPERKYAIGGHPSGKVVTLSDERRIIGGLAGVIIDARGRALGDGPANGREAKVRQWLDAVNGVTPSSLRPV